MKRRLRILIPVLAVVAIVTVVVVTRNRSSDGSGLFASGTVEAIEADLAFQVPGRIEAIHVQEGESVSPGQELAVLDRSELVAVLAEAEARLTQARAQLREMEEGARPQELRQADALVAEAREGVEDATRDLERARRLFEGGAISRQARDKAETSVTLAQARLDRALEERSLLREGPREERRAAQRSAVAAAEAGVARADAALRNAEIRSPGPGIVAVRHREPGESVGAGSPILSVRDLGDRWVRIFVREDRIGRVNLGQDAEIRSDTYPDRVYRGEVVFIGSEAEFTPRNVQTTEERTRLVYPVKVQILDDPAVDLKPGIPADVTLLENSGG